MPSIANRNPKLGSLIFAIWACLAAGELHAQTVEPSPTTANIAPAQIEQWVRQLDDDRFDIRQRAQQQLEQTRPAPLEALATAANHGTLESTTRALNILLGWTDTQDESLRLATLEKLSHLTHRPSEAALAARLLADRREWVALRAMGELGAKISDMRISSSANRHVQFDKRWKGGDEGLKHLKDIRGVKILSLHGTPVTDAGLKHLAQLPELQRVELYGIKASKAGIKKLESQLHADVDARKGAQLGVAGNLDGQGTVTTVVADSAAAKAGILPGDRITGFNGEQVENFEALTRRIAEHRAGDTATLTIVRKDKTLKVQATFDQWGANEKVPTGNQRFNQGLQIQRRQHPNQIFPPQIKMNIR